MNKAKSVQDAAQEKKKAFIIDTYNSRLEMLFCNLNLVVERIQDETISASKETGDEKAIYSQMAISNIGTACLPVMNLILMDMQQLIDEANNEVYEVLSCG